MVKTFETYVSQTLVFTKNCGLIKQYFETVKLNGKQTVLVKMSLTENKMATNPSAVFSEMSAAASEHVLTKKQQKRTSHSKPIPVRQTLTSKLRMINAASVVSSNASDKVDTRQLFRAVKPPVRRPQLHKAVANGKQSSDFIRTFSERIATVKKGRVIYQQKNTEKGIFKENNSPLICTSQKFRVLSVESGGVTSKLNRMNAVDKCDKSKIIYKKNALFNQNINKPVRTPITNNQLWDKTIFQCNHSGNYFKSGRKTPSKTSVLNNKKRRGFNVAKEDKHAFESFHIQITKSVNRSCHITTEDNEAKDELRKAKRRSKELVVVSTSKDQFPQTRLFQDRSNLAFNPRQCNFPSKAPNVSTTIYSDSIKRVEEWLKGRKSKHNDSLLHNSGLFERHSALDSETDKTRINTEKAVTSESVHSMNSFSSHRKKDNECYDEKCILTQAATENIKENELLNHLHPKTFTNSNNVYNERDVCLAVFKSRPCVKDLTKYWEYLTALEKANSDFSSEVNSYGQAISSGADVQLVERNLRELEGRFRSLRMSLRDENLTDCAVK